MYIAKIRRNRILSLKLCYRYICWYSVPQKGPLYNTDERECNISKNMRPANMRLKDVSGPERDVSIRGTHEEKGKRSIRRHRTKARKARKEGEKRPRIPHTRHTHPSPKAARKGRTKKRKGENGQTERSRPAERKEMPNKQKGCTKQAEKTGQSLYFSYKATAAMYIATAQLYIASAQIYN